jgi:hypothetical protein
MKKAILIFFGLLYQIAFTQTAKSDLEQLNKKYISAKQMMYSAKYKLFAGNSNVPVETYSTSFKKNGEEYFSKTSDEEYLVNKKYIVFVDHESKEILIQNNTDKKNSDIQKMITDSPNMAAYLDTLISFYKSIEPLPLAVPNCRAYRFVMKNGPYSKVDMVIDTKQWVVKEVVLYFTQKEEINGKDQDVYIKISFENYSTNPVTGSDFSEAKYVTRLKENFKVKPGYSKYTLYDQTSL